MKKLKILVVDDNRDFAESMADILELNGHDVGIAYSGEEAIELFKQKKFDIIFMDVKLPWKNGVESFMEIRKIKPCIKVIIMTGCSVQNLLKQAVKNDAWDILHKPLKKENLLKMLEKIKPNGVLIADDDPEFVNATKEFLEHNDYHVLIANNGEEAIKKIKSNGIDILILKLGMSALNGLDAYLELKKTGFAIPTIITTAYSKDESEVIDSLYSMSATGILTKPFDPEELLEILQNI